MNIQSNIKTTSIKNDYLTISLLESGDIFRIHHENNQINLLRGNLIDGQAANLYLRVLENGKYEYQKMIGIHSSASYEILNNQVIYQGIAFGIKYQITLSLIDNLWYYDVLIPKQALKKTYDIYYGQDIGIASVGSILASEAYTAHYIDHAVYETETGFVIRSRQNQGDPILLQIGSLTKTVSYATDGFQVFGLNYKKTNQIEAFKQDNLPNVNLQYEFPYITLQSEKYNLEKDTHIVFYGYYEKSHEAFETKPIEINHQNFKLKDWVQTPIKQKIESVWDTVITGEVASESYIESHYPNRRMIEDNGSLLSFFTDDFIHVVTSQKELVTERPHGHLIISGEILDATPNVFSTTNFMFGVFSSHTVLGNTSFHKLTSGIRNALNVQKISGERLWVKKDGKWALFGLPSLYEMGVNYAKWIYILKDDIITVTLLTDILGLQQSFILESRLEYEFVVTNQLTFGTGEYERTIPVQVNGNKALLTPDSNDMILRAYPKLKYQFESEEPVSFQDEAILLGDSYNYHGILAAHYKKTNRIHLHLVGSYIDQLEYQPIDFNSANKSANAFINQLAHFEFSHQEAHELNKLKSIVFWYTHNALVHYASPHGLEQSNGAAWGTRDVLQGPVELFMSAQRFDIVRTILLKTYQRQFIENGDFPQWFMFDNYKEIQAHESHGDIIMWPLKALGDYIKETGDISILDEKVPFMSMHSNQFVLTESTLQDHVFKALETIENSFINGTHLPAYGGGDWNDTLQPANQKLTSHMVSAWTVELFYQALSTLEKETENRFQLLHQKIQEIKAPLLSDYNRYLVKDGVPTGFVVFEENHLDYLLHPTDQNTGLHYRLLTFNRGMISELFENNQIDAYVSIINQHLKHPDGMRLMDTAVTYRGGKKTYFMRAETTSYFGREVGIQYVHAHIRYIEAMSKIGHADSAFEGLLKVNPILIQEEVPNALNRQSNMYFSSSDAAFNDRYQAKKEFEKVRSGKVQVKGGWRLYSSGPGIYIHQIIGNILGISLYHGDLKIDPVLPKKLDGLKLTYHYLNKPVQITYKFGIEEKLLLNGVIYHANVSINKYRNNGYILSKQDLESLKEIHLEVTLKQ